MRRLRLTLRGLIAKMGWGLIWLSKRVFSTPEERWGETAEKRARPWFEDPNHQALRSEYPLDADSLILDVGGYEGSWTSEMFSRYLCKVEIFEPVEQFAEALTHRFARNPAVTVHAFGLGPRDETTTIHIAGDASSTLASSVNAPSEPAVIRDIAGYFTERGFGRIDLIKVNIEGAEYGLLDRLLDCGLVGRIRYLQVQFHEHVPDAVARRDEIRKRLSATHSLMWDYPFVWESWEASGGTW